MWEGGRGGEGLEVGGLKQVLLARNFILNSDAAANYKHMCFGPQMHLLSLP